MPSRKKAAAGGGGGGSRKKEQKAQKAQRVARKKLLELAAQQAERASVLLAMAKGGAMELSEARRLLKDAVAAVKAHNPGSALHVSVLINTGHVLHRTGQLEEAMTEHRVRAPRGGRWRGRCG